MTDISEIETYILNFWLETGLQPSIEHLAEKFGVTEEDIDPLVMDDEDEELETEYDSCPCCGSLFGFEEQEWQQCDACGWPAEDCEDDDYDDEDYEPSNYH